MPDTLVNTSRALRARQEPTKLRLGLQRAQTALQANTRQLQPLSTATSVAPIPSLLQAVQSASVMLDSVGPRTPAELAPRARTRQQLGARPVGTVLPESLPADRRPPSVTTALRILTPPQAAQFASAMEDLRVRAHAQLALLASSKRPRAQPPVPTVTLGRTRRQQHRWNAPPVQ